MVARRVWMVLFGWPLFLVAVWSLLCVAPALAKKDHCRSLEFSGAAGELSHDKVTFRIVEPDGSLVNQSCLLQIQTSETAVNFVKRLATEWGTADGATCPTADPIKPAKKACSNGLLGHSCKLKRILRQKKDGTIKKGPAMEVCCFEGANCKGRKLGKISVTALPVSAQWKVDVLDFCPADEDLPAGVENCPVALDPIGIVERPYPGLQGCREDLGDAVASLAATVASTLSSCHRQRMAGQIPETTDCNSVNAQSDSAGAVPAAESDLTEAASRCALQGSPGAFGYRSCPAPCDAITIGLCSAGTTGSACNSDRDCDTSAGALDGRCGDWDQAAACLACRTKAAIAQAITDKYGTPGTSLSESAQQCQNTIGQALRSLVRAEIKETTKCQARVDREKLALPHGVSFCKDADPKGKRAKAEIKAAQGVSKVCLDAVISELDAICGGATTSAELEACVVDNGRQVNDVLSETAFPETGTSSPTGTCPGKARMLFVAGTFGSCTADADCGIGHCSAGRCTTVTDVDLGWTGTYHDQDINNGERLDVTLSCGAGSAPCGSCSVTGIDPAAGSCRCVNDSSILCDQPFQVDLVSCGGNLCECFLGAPLPVSAGLTPFCALSKLANDVSGTMDVDTGDTAMTIDLDFVMHTGISQDQPCPICVGDTVPADGVRSGACAGGPRDGLACDLTSNNATFGPLSLDCLPSPGTNVSGSGLPMVRHRTTGSTLLPSRLACDPLLPGLSCPCGLCSNDASIPCSADPDCSALGDGTCSLPAGGTLTAPNGCNDFTCTATGGNEGECAAGPVDSFCDGELRANGEGFLVCAVDLDCATLDPICGDGSAGSCGSCTLSKRRECFLDPIAASGSADPSKPVTVSTFCISPTASAGLNSAIGLPGAGRMATQEMRTLFCASNPGRLYTPGRGGCP